MVHVYGLELRVGSLDTRFIWKKTYLMGRSPEANVVAFYLIWGYLQVPMERGVGAGVLYNSDKPKNGWTVHSIIESR